MRLPYENELDDANLIGFYRAKFNDLRSAHPEADEETIIGLLRSHLRSQHRPLLGGACNPVNTEGKSISIDDPAVKEAWGNGGPGFENPHCPHCQKPE